MFEQGNIIYFDPFYFKNGNLAKSKYFIVLKVFEGKSILASLPSSKDFVPQTHETQMGCVELPESNFNCFVIAPNAQITTNGKGFQFKTHLYGHQLDTYETKLMNEIYPVEGLNYEVWGKMTQTVFNEIINCFKNSKTVKRKYKALL